MYSICKIISRESSHTMFFVFSQIFTRLLRPGVWSDQQILGYSRECTSATSVTQQAAVGPIPSAETVEATKFYCLQLIVLPKTFTAGPLLAYLETTA